jgi:transposase
MKLTRHKLAKKKQLKLLELFVGEVTARTAADLVGINRNTANLFYTKLRSIITHCLEQVAQDCFAGEIELDESYFGGVHKVGGAVEQRGKYLFFHIKKKRGSVYTGLSWIPKNYFNAHNKAQDSAR